MKTKRFLSIIMALGMVISIVQLPSFAGSDNSYEILFDMSNIESGNGWSHPSDFSYANGVIKETSASSVVNTAFVLDEAVTAEDGIVRTHVEFMYPGPGWGEAEDEGKPYIYTFVSNGDTYEETSYSEGLRVAISMAKGPTSGSSGTPGNLGYGDGSEGGLGVTYPDDNGFMTEKNVWYSLDSEYDFINGTAKHYVDDVLLGTQTENVGSGFKMFGIRSDRRGYTGGYPGDRYYKNVRITKGSGATVSNNRLTEDINGDKTAEVMLIFSEAADITAENVEVRSAATGETVTLNDVTKISDTEYKLSYNPIADGLYSIEIKNTGSVDCKIYTEMATIVEKSYNFVTEELKGEHTMANASSAGSGKEYFGMVNRDAATSVFPDVLQAGGTARFKMNVNMPIAGQKIEIMTKGLKIDGSKTSDGYTIFSITSKTRDVDTDGTNNNSVLDDTKAVVCNMYAGNNWNATEYKRMLNFNINQPADNNFEIELVFDIKETGTRIEGYVEGELIYYVDNTYMANYQHKNISWLCGYQPGVTEDNPITVLSTEGVYEYTKKTAPAVLAVKYILADGTKKALDANVSIDPAKLKGLEVKFTEEVTEDIIGLTVGELDISKFIGEFDETNTVYTLMFNQNLAQNTDFTLNIPIVETVSGKTNEYTALIKTGEGSISIDSLTVDEAKANAELTNYGTSGCATIIYALYDEGKMVEVDFTKNDYTAADAKVSLTKAITGYKDEFVAKAFLVKDFSNISPMTESAKYPKTEDVSATPGKNGITQTGSGKIKITKESGDIKNGQVNIMIYYPGKSASDLEENNIQKNIETLAYFGSVNTDAKGGYAVDIAFDENAKSGTYTFTESGVDQNKEIETFEMLSKDDLILKEVKEADGYEELKEIIENYADYLELDTKNTSSKAYNNMSGEYESIDELKDDFEAMKKKYPVSISTGGSNGGGSRPTGSKGNATNVISGNVTLYEPKPEVNNPEELNRYVFDDIENVEWAREAICALAEAGVLSGKGERLFYPDDLVTREEFVKMIVAAFKISAENPSCDLTDVKKDVWYYPYVATAYTKGIIKGDGVNFGVGNHITRQDLSVIAYNGAKSAGITFSNVDGSFMFDDDSKISDYAKEAVYSLQNEGVVNGIDMRNFAPKNNATRAQAAKIVYLLLEMMD